MMTIRQINEVCKRGYIYDIEKDRFISKEEDDEMYYKMYPDSLARVIAAFAQSVFKYVKKHKEAGTKYYTKKRVE